MTSLHYSGAGIGGLTLSTALKAMEMDQKLEIDIYEASSQVSEIGAGIGFWPRGWSIFKTLGLEESLLKIVPRPPNDNPRRRLSAVNLDGRLKK